MTKTSDKPEVKRCHHCGHEWEPRVKNPKKCPQCQNSLWKSPSPKKLRTPKAPVDVLAAQTSTEASEEDPLTLPIIDTSMEADPPDASGAEVYKSGNEMFVGRTALSVEPSPVETPIQRARREVEERLRRLADEPIE